MEKTAQNKLMTVSEVADFLRVTETTIRAWIKESKIPYIKVSDRAIRFRKADIEAYLEEKKTGKAVRRVSSSIDSIESSSSSIISIKNLARLLDIPPEKVQERVTRPEYLEALRVDVKAFSAILEGEE